MCYLDIGACMVTVREVRIWIRRMGQPEGKPTSLASSRTPPSQSTAQTTMTAMNEGFLFLWWNAALPSSIPKAPPTRARVKKVLSEILRPASIALRLSKPIRIKPNRPERASQPATKSHTGLKSRPGAANRVLKETMRLPMRGRRWSPPFIT